MSNIKESLILILLGPPGSGKGTQAKIFCREFKIPQISTGDLFRENISKETPIGLQAKTFIQEGQLVPDEIVLGMLYERISKPDCQNGYLLDGFPRTITQAEEFAKYEKRKITVVNLDVSDEELIRRATGRLICRQCGAIYHSTSFPPKIENQCDICDGELYRRLDDTQEVVENRLRVYRAQTKPLEDFFQKKGILKKINGCQPADQIFSQIKLASALK